jgi:hypothetical protein
VAVELLSRGSSSPSGFALHSRNMCGLPLALGLLGHYGWLLWQEGELPGRSNAGTDFLPAECSDGTADVVAEETASGTGAGADADAGCRCFGSDRAPGVAPRGAFCE